MSISKDEKQAQIIKAWEDAGRVGLLTACGGFGNTNLPLRVEISSIIKG